MSQCLERQTRVTGMGAHHDDRRCVQRIPGKTLHITGEGLSWQRSTRSVQQRERTCRWGAAAPSGHPCAMPCTRWELQSPGLTGPHARQGRRHHLWRRWMQPVQQLHQLHAGAPQRIAVLIAQSLLSKQTCFLIKRAPVRTGHAHSSVHASAPQ